MLDDGTIEYEEGDPEEWFSTLKKKGGSLTKEGIAKFSSDQWKDLGFPYGVVNLLKEWISSPPQGNNLSEKCS